MNDDSELQINDNWPDESTPAAKRRRIESGNSKSIRILLGVLLVLFFAGGIFYFISKQSTGGGASPLQSKVTALEQKIAALETQLAELQEKINTSGSDPAVLKRVDALAQKLEALEKEKQPIGELKTKSSAPSKPAVSTRKQYHTVQKGETLQGISKKYRISVEQLRKLNDLSADKPLRTGQKLLVSAER